MSVIPGGPVIRTSPSSAESMSWIPGWGAEIPHALWPKNQNINQKQYYKKKLNKEFKQ